MRSIFALLFLALTITAVVAQAGDRENRTYVTLRMSGESRIEIPAEYADISATVEHTYSNQTGELTDSIGVVRNVSKHVATGMTRVIDVLHGTTNVSRIRTTDIDLSPIYNYTSGGQILTGYRASNSISFRVTLPSASSILDSILGAGVSRINSIAYAASSDRVNATRLTAIQQAIADAQTQAEAAAKQIPTDAKPRIISIDMTQASRPAPVPMPFAGAMAMARLESVSMMPIVGGELTITARARVKFAVDLPRTSRMRFL